MCLTFVEVTKARMLNVNKIKAQNFNASRIALKKILKFDYFPLNFPDVRNVTQFHVEKILFFYFSTK